MSNNYYLYLNPYPIRISNVYLWFKFTCKINAVRGLIFLFLASCVRESCPTIEIPPCPKQHLYMRVDGAVVDLLSLPQEQLDKLELFEQSPIEDLYKDTEYYSLPLEDDYEE